MRKRARPTSWRFRNSTQRCASSAVSTTKLSSAPHAVLTATSRRASIVPRSPSRPSKAEVSSSPPGSCAANNRDRTAERERPSEKTRFCSWH